MSRTRTAAGAVALLALLAACSGSGGSTTPTSAPPASSASSSTGGTITPTPEDSSSPSGSGAAAGSLVALQLCGTTLGYAAGAIAGVPADQLAKLKEGVASAQSKAGAGDAELVAASQAVVDAVAAGDQEAITSTGQTMGDLCGAGG